MKKFFRFALLCAVIAPLFTPPAAQADADSIARDKKRMELFGDVACVYYTNQGTIKYEFLSGGVLTATFRTSVRQGGWYVENDKFCVASPITGKVSCNKLRQTAIQTREEAVAYLGGFEDSKCYD